MIKTINLLANVEQAVEVTGGVHARFENMGDGTVYVSKSANATAGGDGVIAVSSGATKYMKNVAAYGEYSGEYGYKGTVYIKADTSCKVEIETGDYFFKSINSGKGGAMTGKFVKIKGRVDTVDDLPLIADEGDLYFVGAESDEDSDEYVYTADGKWELIGNTEVDLSGYVKTSDMADKYGIDADTVSGINERLEGKEKTRFYTEINNAAEVSWLVKRASHSIWGETDFTEHKYLVIVSYPTGEKVDENSPCFVGIINYAIEAKYSIVSLIDKNVTMNNINGGGTVVMERFDGGSYENQTFNFIALN